MIVVVFFFLVCSVILAFRSKRVFGVAWLLPAVLSVYMVPAFVFLLFPYDYGLPINNFALVSVLLLVTLMALVIQAPRGGGLGAVMAQFTQYQTLMTLGAWLSVFFILAQIAVFPDLILTPGANNRRKLLEMAGAFYKIGAYLSGLSIVSSLFVFGDRPLIRRLLALAPALITATLFVYMGNRQFVFFTLVFLLAFKIHLSGTEWLRRPVVWVTLTVFAFGMGAFTLFRESEMKGRYEEFLVNSFALKEKPDGIRIENESLRLGVLTFGIYYGLQYQNLTISIEGDVSKGMPLAYTFPMIYRRIDGLPGLVDFDSPEMSINLDRSAVTGGFGGTWGTMFTDFYSEFGYYSFYLYPCVFALAYVVFRRVLSRNKFGDVLINVFYVASIVFGIQFFVFKEFFAYLLSVGVIALFLATPVGGPDLSNDRRRLAQKK